MNFIKTHELSIINKILLSSVIEKMTLNYYVVGSNPTGAPTPRNRNLLYYSLL